MRNEEHIEQGEGESYAEHLRSFLKAIDTTSVELAESYIWSRENRLAHFRLISLCRQTWIQLFPKVMYNERLAENFKQWMPVIYDPKILLIPRYENLIWNLVMDIRDAFEHLGLTKIE